jgi:hypothetical protein
MGQTYSQHNGRAASARSTTTSSTRGRPSAAGAIAIALASSVTTADPPKTTQRTFMYLQNLIWEIGRQSQQRTIALLKSYRLMLDNILTKSDAKVSPLLMIQKQFMD